MLTGLKIYLRTLEPSDAALLLSWENDAKNWRVSQTVVPFSQELIQQYVQSAQDLFSVGQIRFMICDQSSHEPIGSVDLFDYAPLHQRAGIGILISAEHREKGVATEALTLVEEYAQNTIGMRQLHCTIFADNASSIRLFEKSGYQKVGERTEWYFSQGTWHDELLFVKKLNK